MKPPLTCFNIIMLVPLATYILSWSSFRLRSRVTASFTLTVGTVVVLVVVASALVDNFLRPSEY